MLHPEIGAALHQLEQATHAQGALFLVREGSDPWDLTWARGATELFGATEDWWDEVHPDDRTNLRASLAALESDGVVEYRVVSPVEGGAGWVRESVRRVQLPDGETFLVSVLRDVSRMHEPGPGPEDAATAVHPPIGGGVLVLLVEDDEAVRGVLARVLAREGFSTLLAGSCEEAMRVLDWAPRPPEVLVADVVLPDRSGTELARRLSDRMPNLPVLYISGYGADDLERRGDLPRGGPLLSKPFTPAEFTQAIRACLALRSRGGGGGTASGPEVAAS